MTGFTRHFIAFAGRRGLWTLFLMIAGGLFEGIGLALLVPILTLLTAQRGGQIQMLAAKGFAALGVESQLARLALLLAALIGVMFVRAIVLMVRDRRLAELQNGYVEHQRVRLIRAVGNAAWQDIAGLHHARVTNALTVDIQRISGASQMALQMAATAVMLLAQLLLTLIVAPGLAGLAFLFLLAGAVSAIPILRRADKLGQQLGAKHLSMVNSAGQMLAGLKLAAAQNLQSAFAAEFEVSSRQLTASQLAFQRASSRARVFSSTGVVLAGAAMLFVGFWLEGPTASLIGGLLIVSRMSGPAVSLQQNAQQLVSMLPAHTEVMRLMADLERGAVPMAEDEGQPMQGEIRFEGVRYHYGGETAAPALDAVDLTIKPGEMIGVVGESGAGKTTFLDLLSGLVEPTTGAISIGGEPLNRHSAKAWRDRIAYVPQDAFLFNDTLRRNILWACPNTGDAEIWAALELVEAAQFVRGMEAGLETVVAERGTRLSGGERQRIALARALLRRPAFLILDEATNAIDIAAERRILANMRLSGGQPGMLIVSHRGETLQACDRRLVFDRGKLISDSIVPAFPPATARRS